MHGPVNVIFIGKCLPVNTAYPRRLEYISVSLCFIFWEQNELSVHSFVTAYCWNEKNMTLL